MDVEYEHRQAYSEVRRVKERSYYRLLAGRRSLACCQFYVLSLLYNHCIMYLDSSYEYLPRCRDPTGHGISGVQLDLLALCYARPVS